MSKHQRLALMSVSALATLLLDLLSKAWANTALEPSVRQTFVPSLLNFVLVKNTGLAFSMANQSGLLAKLLSGFVFIALLYYYGRRYIFAKESEPFLQQLGLSIIIGAAAGNLFERLLYGHVTDFLEFAFVSFPVFNVADVLIDTGIGLMLISMFRTKKPT